MIKVSKYVDMTRKEFQGKSELEIWMMLPAELQQWVTVNHISEVIHNAIIELGEKVGSAVIAVVKKEKEKKTKEVRSDN